MEEQKQLPERFPCSGCAFSYTTGRGRGEYKGQQVIRKHNSRTGPGLCEGAGRPPAVPMSAEDAGRSIAQSTINGAPLSTPEDVPEVLPADAFSAPARVKETAPHGNLGPWVTASFESECDGTGCQILEGDLIRSDGMDGWLCESCGQDPEHESSPVPDTVPLPDPPRCSDYVMVPDGSHDNMVKAQCDGPEGHGGVHHNEQYHSGWEISSLPPAVPAEPDPFQSPAKAPEPAPSISGQPEPERDSYGRYKLPLGKAGKLIGVTRATTFAKSTSDTFNLSQWGDRMVIKGLVLRPDLLALAHGLDVKRDRDAMNSIAEQAKEAAGNKVAANLGTALHAFTERLDAGQMTLAQAPVEYQPKLALYTHAVQEAGLATRMEWIERTTAVTVPGTRKGVQEEVAGTLDRIAEAVSEDRFIVDLKTGANLSYGWGEIAVQLALYARGVNQRGLYDRTTRTWCPMDRPVRDDFAIVVHLPADPTDGGKHPDRAPWCQLYWVDLQEGWEAAGLNADVRSWRRTKNLARPLQPEDLAPVTEWGPQDGAVAEVTQMPALPPAEQLTITPQNVAIAQAAEALRNAREAQARWDNAVLHFTSATSRDALAQLWQYATDCGHFDPGQVRRLTEIGMSQLNLLESSPG